MIAATFAPARAHEYRSPGGAWSGPTLDQLLAATADAGRVERLAGGLRALGAAPGTVVAWQSPNRVEVAWLFRACWRLGAIAAPLHHQLGPAERDSMLAELGDPLLIDIADLPDGEPAIDLWREPEALGAVLFTSGSTGRPKGVLHTQATLAYKATTMRAAHAITEADTVLMPAPCSHISGLLNGVTVPGVSGARVVFMAKWDPATALDLIEEHRVTFMIGPPTFFVSLMDSPDFSTPRVASLRLISTGGAGITPAFAERARREFDARVKRTYGSTEAPTVATSLDGDGTSRDSTHDGHAIGAVELRLGTGGELLVRGPEVCVGYLDPIHTAAAFDTEGWFHTGDLATIDADGWLTITGRTNDIVIRGGENIAAAEVERALEAHPHVRAAAVVGEPDDRLGERVVAYVVTDGSTFTLGECRSWFESQGLARFKTPERVVVVDALPVLASGKPDKAALRQRSQGNGADRPMPA